MGKVQRPLHAIQADRAHAGTLNHVADNRGVAAKRVALKLRQRGLSRFPGDGNHQFAFIGEVKRIQA